MCTTSNKSRWDQDFILWGPWSHLRRDTNWRLHTSNVQVGQESEIRQGSIGDHRIRKMKDNERFLAAFYTSHNLTITNTIFKHKPHHKCIWQYPQSKMCHMIDHTIIKQQCQGQVWDGRVSLTTNCFSDYCLMFICNSKSNIKRRPTSLLGSLMSTASMTSICRKWWWTDCTEEQLGKGVSPTLRKNCTRKGRHLGISL